MVGVVEDFLDESKIMKNLLDESEVNTFVQPAKSVNQWRQRSINGRQGNIEFWYNSGSLTGEALLQQFMQVVMRCEMVGQQIVGFVCDAGGNNAKLFTLLRNRMAVGEGGWVDIDVVRTVNPWDTKRFIYLFHCATHDLKNLRNALYASWTKGGARELLDATGIKIGKGIIVESHQRDVQREMNNEAPMSMITNSTVNLTKWSVMNVSEALRPTSEKALSEMALALYKAMGYSAKDVRERTRGEIGYWPAVARHLKSLLLSHPDKAEQLGPSISSYQWLANIHEIFNATLMNMDLKFHAYNIDR